MSGAKRIQIYDTTLRDGSQGEGVSFSAIGKVRMARRLDEFGVDYIEGGYPGSNPKDVAFFRDIRREKLAHAKVAAFGSTRRANVRVAEDGNIICLLEAETPVITIVGKTSELHVREVLRTTAEENRAMIADSVAYLKEKGREVIFDAEHFFDGFKANPEHSLAALRAAAGAGVDMLVLCDTNGGTLPDEVFEITRQVVAAFPGRVGIHTHNDMELGVANSLAALRAGAVQVQGTMNGFGERCGNANLISLLPILSLKMGLECGVASRLKELRDVSLFADELANQPPNPKAPFVGQSAFGHKAGLHANAVQKNPATFEHISPEAVGNVRRILISEGAGGSSIILKALELGEAIDKSSPEVRDILEQLKDMESRGYEFEAADASFKMLIQKVLKKHKPFFKLEGYRVLSERVAAGGSSVCEASVKLVVKGEREHTVAEADGPVEALDRALRKSLMRFYPAIANVSLTDYRVRILDPEHATAAKTRVLIDSTDGHSTWTTVGVSENIIEASWEALVDSVEYKLFMDESANG